MLTTISITSKTRQTTSTLTTTAIVTKTLHTLLALHLLLTFNLLFTTQTSTTSINALPITSKPIENTAENIAWQAWLMLPPEQKNLEKSRKVTPKSIFTLPFRECPPGHHLYESRCIPTVSIDQSELLAQQLLGFVVEGGNANDNNYEFDYDDTDSELLMYDAPQKSNSVGSTGKGGGSGIEGVNPAPSNYDDASQLPSQDAPLKFSIFQQRFPTDYEAEMSPPVVAEGLARQTERAALENRTATLFQGLPISDARRKFLERHANLTKGNNITTTSTTAETGTSTTVTTSATDLQSDSSDFSTVFMENFDENAAGDEKDAIEEEEKEYREASADTPATSTSKKSTISEIDATVLPAGDRQPAADAKTADNVENGEHVDLETDKTQNRVSLKLNEDGNNATVDEQLEISKKPDERNFNEDAASTVTEQDSAEPPQSDIAQLLKAEALLPLFNMTQTAAESSTLTLHDSTTLLGHSTAALTEEDVTNISVSEADAETDMTTMPTFLSELLGEVVSNERGEVEIEVAKDDRERSAEKDLDVQIKTVDRETLPEPIDTASTPGVIEEIPIVREQETFLSNQQQQQQQQNVDKKLVVFKKSKVEPVSAVVETTTSTMKTTPLPTTTVNQNKYVGDVVHDDNDQFHYQHQPVLSLSPSESELQSAEVTMNDQVEHDVHQSQSSKQQQPQHDIGATIAVNDDSSGNTANMDEQQPLNSIETNKTSEIDIAEELRMINELVKGKRQPVKSAKTTTTTKNLLTKTATTSTPAIIATYTTTQSTLTSTTESSLTTETLETKENITESKSNAKATRTNIPGMATATILSTSKTSASSDNQTNSFDMKRVAEKSKTFKAAPAVLKKIVAISNNNNNNNFKSNAGSRNAVPTTAATTTTTSAATTVATSLQPSTTIVATIWSKIMPMLGFGSKATVTPTTTKTESEAAVSTTTTFTLTPPTTTHNPLPSFNNNRSNRNSKIIRINQLETTNNAAVDAPDNSKSRPTTTTSTVQASKGFQPLWWLPTSWRLDRQSDADNSDVEQSLLLRFWSAFPGNQAKV